MFAQVRAAPTAALIRPTVREWPLAAAGEPGVDFDFDEHGGVDQPGDLHERGGGADGAEAARVHRADGGPIFDVDQVDAGADHVLERGAELRERGGGDLQAAFRLRAGKLRGANILLAEASVTATENLVLAAVLACGTTVINNAAGEPHIQDLCRMLNGLGAKIEGAGSNRITITGVTRLEGGEARVGADFMEVGSFIGAAVVTGGEITIRDADPGYLDMVAMVFGRLGVRWNVRGADLHVPGNQTLAIVPDLGGRIPVIKAQPWPGFPPDLMSIAVVIATCSSGAVLFHDWMYESRFFFTDNLTRMGARITMLDPHRVLVQGPTIFRPVDYISSPDIRAGMAMLLAALAAKGVTRIANTQQIDRGYERVDETLNALGARVTRVNADAVAVPAGRLP